MWQTSDQRHSVCQVFLNLRVGIVSSTDVNGLETHDTHTNIVSSLSSRGPPIHRSSETYYSDMNLGWYFFHIHQLPPWSPEALPASWMERIFGRRATEETLLPKILSVNIKHFYLFLWQASFRFVSCFWNRDVSNSPLSTFLFSLNQSLTFLSPQ
jgi:hypothetical protein